MLQWSDYMCSATWPNKSAQAVLISPVYQNSFICHVIGCWVELLNHNHTTCFDHSPPWSCRLFMSCGTWKCQTEKVRNSFAVAWIEMSLFLYANSPLKGRSREEEWWSQVWGERRGSSQRGGCWRNRWWRDTDSLYSIYSSIASLSQHPHPC